MYLKKLHL